jgi:hypothetical protein
MHRIPNRQQLNEDKTMSFHVNVDSLPYLRSYTQAKGRYDSTTPIRGSNNVRPLGDRKKKHMRIEEAKRNGAGAAGIACVLYNTPCVTYYEDGTLHLAHGGYISRSTIKFIARVAPVSGVHMDSARQCLVVRVAGGEYQCGNDGLWLKFTETGGYVPVDPEPFSVTLVDRAAMREAKRQYKEFMTYAIGLGKLTQWDKPALEPGETTYAHSDKLLDAMRSEDIDDWAWAYPRLLLQAGVAHTGWDYINKRYFAKWVCSVKRLNDTLTHLIKGTCGGEVLRREALPLGVHKRGPNAKYAGTLEVKDE